MVVTYSIDERIGKTFTALINEMNKNRGLTQKKFNRSAIVEEAIIKFIEKNQKSLRRDK